MTDAIDYGKLMHKALRRVMVDVLHEVAANGLPGDHHFYIAFDTTHPGVDIADWLREQYPEEMTIVMQEWFDNLSVMDDRFAITLNFNNNPEPLVIPFDSVKTFVDPSVEFGLRFDGHEVEPEPDPDDEIPVPEAEDDGAHEVVSLDAFRKS